MQLAPSTLAQWIGAVATSLAVVVALFKDAIVGCLLRPKLTIRIKPTYPDCVKMPVSFSRVGSPQWTGEAYWLRLWVENTGHRRAEKVQVFLSSVRRKQRAGGSFEPVERFIPMNLRWSNTDFFKPEIYADGISPKMGKYCDLACISDPTNPMLQPLPDVVAGQATLDLWVEVFPSDQGNRLSPNEYELEIKTAGSNCPPMTHHISLNLKGQWFADEKKMFSDGVGVHLN
jgi:hypothetical protein